MSQLVVQSRWYGGKISALWREADDMMGVSEGHLAGEIGSLDDIYAVRGDGELGSAGGESIGRHQLAEDGEDFDLHRSGCRHCNDTACEAYLHLTLTGREAGVSALGLERLPCTRSRFRGENAQES